MKTSARFLAMLLAVLMIAGAVMTVSAGKFTDVADTYEHRDAIDVLTQLGIIAGYEDGSFKPEAKIERDEMAKLMFVLYTTFNDAGSASAGFSDTKDNWAEGFIAWCTAENIVGGFGDGTFRPDSNITYDQALKMVCTTLGYRDFSSAKWPTDVRLVGIKQLKLNNKLPETLAGSDELTRGQVAQIIYNALFAEMYETKTVTYTQVSADGISYKVPIQVNKQLALDVWNFKTYKGKVAATENFGEAAGTGKDDVIRVTGFVDDETGLAADAKLNLDRDYLLEELGLKDYAGKTDELFARDVKVFYLDGEIVENTALVYGKVDYDVKLATVKKSDGKADDITKIEVAGTKYDIYGKDGVYYTMSATGKVTKATEAANSFPSIPSYDASYSTFPKDADGNLIRMSTDLDKDGSKDYVLVPEILLTIVSPASYCPRDYSSAAIDSDGDGEYDLVFVIPQNLYQVVKSEVVTDTTSKKKVTQYTVQQLLKTWTRTVKTDGYNYSATPKNNVETFTFYADDVVSAEALAEDDIIIAGMFANKFRVDSKITGVETYITFDSDGGTRFADYNPTSTNYWNNLYNTLFYGTCAATKISGVGKDNTTAVYYVVNGRVLYAENAKSATEPVKFAVLVATSGQTDFEYDSVKGKYLRKYPALLVIDGKQTTVNVNAINGITSLEGKEYAPAPTGNIYAQLMMNVVNGEAVYANKLVAYTIDDDGYYQLYTADVLTPTHAVFADIDTEEEVVLAKDLAVSYAKSSGFYKIGTTYFELDDKSVIYYVDKDGVLSTYTKNNIPKEFKDGTTTSTVAYFVNADQYVKTLVATMITGELDPANNSGVNDPENHLLFLGDGNGKLVDGTEVYYIYKYINLLTGELTETHSILPAEKSTTYTGTLGIPMFNGYIGAYADDAKTMEVVKLDTNPSVKLTKITGYFAATSSIFTAADTDGLRLLDAKFVEADIEATEEDATKYELVGATLTSFDDLASAYDDAVEDGKDFYIIYGYEKDTNGNKVVKYVIYGSMLDNQYEQFRDVFHAPIV